MYAEAQFASQQQEVIVRVVNAYLDVLFKQDIMALARCSAICMSSSARSMTALLKKARAPHRHAGNPGPPGPVEAACWKPRMRW
jgi:hypothetical protein